MSKGIVLIVPWLSSMMSRPTSVHPKLVAYREKVDTMCIHDDNRTQDREEKERKKNEAGREGRCEENLSSGSADGANFDPMFIWPWIQGTRAAV